MLASCSRLGCGRHAAAVFAFDSLACLVWIDRLDGQTAQAPGAGRLCARHADAMSPPRGWNLLDRRGDATRLWVDGVAPTPANGSGDPSADRSLPFDATSVEPAVSSSPAPDRPVPDRAVGLVELDGLDELLRARTPLLARAFGPVRPNG